MDKKFYVSLDAARLLKEKGYNEDVRNFYDEEGLFLEVEGFYNFEYLTNKELDNNHYAAPTKSEAIDWLESKGIIIEVLQDYRGIWLYVIKISGVGSYVSESNGNNFLTRLQAEDAAIIKALELLQGKEE